MRTLPFRHLPRYRLLRFEAMLWLVVGCHQQVLRKFHHLLKLRPLDRHALASSAHVHVQLNILKPALHNLQQLVAVSPGRVDSLFNLAFVLQQL